MNIADCRFLISDYQGGGVRCGVADSLILPPFPTREEIAEVCNQGMDRKRPITYETVREWERKGLIRPVSGMNCPVRYDAQEVADFINGKREIGAGCDS